MRTGGKVAPNGWHVFRHVHRTFPEIPLIVVSGYGGRCVSVPASVPWIYYDPSSVLAPEFKEFILSLHKE